MVLEVGGSAPVDTITVRFEKVPGTCHILDVSQDHAFAQAQPSLPTEVQRLLACDSDCLTHLLIHGATPDCRTAFPETGVAPTTSTIERPFTTTP